jgi:putative peptidoglycan lipid II flippase
MVFFLSALTIGLGLMVQIGLAAALGTGREMDAFLVAITLPTFINTVAMFTAVSAFVPFLKGQSDSSEPLLPSKSISTIFTTAFLVSFFLVIFVVFAARYIIHITAPGLDPSTAQLASDLLRIMIIGSLFDILRGILTAYFFSKERFYLPQFVPILNHCLLLVSVLFLFRGARLYGVAWAWAAGSLAMFLPLLLIFLRREGFRFAGGFLSPAIRKAWALMIPALIVVVLQQTTPFLDRLAASLLPPGAISYLGYGNKLLDVFIRTIPAAVGVVTFPLLSRQALDRDLHALRDLAMLGMRWILLGTLPLALFVYVLRQPLILILFQRGNFDSSASRGVAEVMGWYAFGFLPASLLYLLTTIGFALQRPWMLALVNFVGMCATLSLNLLLSRLLGPSGIAISYLIIASLLALALAVWYQKFLHIPLFVRDFSWLGKIGLASALFLLVLLVTGYFLPHSTQDSVSCAVFLILSGILGIAAYGVTLYGTGLPEIRSLIQRVAGKNS